MKCQDLIGSSRIHWGCNCFYCCDCCIYCNCCDLGKVYSCVMSRKDIWSEIELADTTLSPTLVLYRTHHCIVGNWSNDQDPLNWVGLHYVIILVGHGRGLLGSQLVQLLQLLGPGQTLQGCNVKKGRLVWNRTAATCWQGLSPNNCLGPKIIWSAARQWN